MKKYIQLLRPRHAIKNILVLLPAVFGKGLSSGATLCRIIPAFLTFCALSSVIYILNDIQDAEKDRMHPIKKNRPIASGAIAKKNAMIVACALLAGIIALGIAARFPLGAWVCLIAYFVLNVGYSLGLKHVPIVDVAILVSGFMLRVLFGSTVTGIAISSWLYLTVMSLSFYLGLGKRRNELVRHKNDTRRVLKYYSYEFLDKNMQLSMALSIVFYALWSINVPTALGTGAMVWTVPFMFCICMKYSLTIEGNSEGDPVEVIFSDRVLIGLLALFSLAMLGLLYL